MVNELIKNCMFEMLTNYFKDLKRANPRVPVIANVLSLLACSTRWILFMYANEWSILVTKIADPSHAPLHGQKNQAARVAKTDIATFSTVF